MPLMQGRGDHDEARRYQGLASFGSCVAAVVALAITNFAADAFANHPPRSPRRRNHRRVAPSRHPPRSRLGRGPNPLRSNESNGGLRLFLSRGDDEWHPLSELRDTSFNALLDRIPPSVRIVLIGEGTHGTEEFFKIRSEATKCLVERRGFDAVVCEGDAEPFFELNEFVAGNSRSTDQEIRSELSRLFGDGFPDWMWSNAPMARFASWLKSHNRRNRGMNKFPVQLLGMDVQSPFDSMDYLTRQLPAMGEKELSDLVAKLYEPFSRYRNNIRKYGSDVYGNRGPSQEQAAKDALDALLQRYGERKSIHGDRDLEAWFRLIQNVHAVQTAEAYHRQRIYPGHTTTWNLRTEFMMNTIVRSMEHIDQMKTINIKAGSEDGAPPARLVVWAHNSHAGDMRSTAYSSLGQVSLGQLCRERLGDDRVFGIGTTTYQGTVRAARADGQGACWRGEGEIVPLRKPPAHSHESALHSIATDLESVCGGRAFGLPLRGARADGSGGAAASFDCNRDERFVGSCYLPETEAMSHYAKCNLASQFDYIVHVDESSAIRV